MGGKFNRACVVPIMTEGYDIAEWYEDRMEEAKVVSSPEECLPRKEESPLEQTEDQPIEGSTGADYLIGALRFVPIKNGCETIYIHQAFQSACYAEALPPWYFLGRLYESDEKNKSGVSAEVKLLADHRIIYFYSANPITYPLALLIVNRVAVSSWIDPLTKTRSLEEKEE